MSDDQALIESFDATIRHVWHDGRWFYSIVDAVGVLAEAPNPRKYWFDMKRTVRTEGFVELLENIRQLRMQAPDGKLRLTDAAGRALTAEHQPKLFPDPNKQQKRIATKLRQLRGTVVARFA